MSDDPLELVRPEPPRSWRDDAAGFAEALDLSPRRLALGLVTVAVVGLVTWRLLAPAAAPPEMSLPFATAGDAASDTAGGAAGRDQVGGAGGGGSAPAGSSTPGSPAASGVAAATEVVVHVAGAVRAPGVQRLPTGSRVVDALEAAGGAEDGADLARLNLAMLLEDGQQVYVPRVGEVPPTPIGGVGGSSGSAAPGAPGGPLINVNTASADELDVLPGVGPTTAAAIIAHRDENGPFTSVEQLLDVRGIGEAKLEQLRDLVTV